MFQDIDKDLLAKFKAFHLDNPHVYKKFKEYAFKIKKTGRKKYSAVTLINVIRWEHDTETTGDVFKINNDFIALYARLLIHHYPEFDNFFELRKMKAFNRRKSTDERYRINAKQNSIHLQRKKSPLRVDHFLR